MTIVLSLVGCLLVFLVVVLVLASRQPVQFRITRTAVMAASPATVFALVNDFHAWQDWSPWAKMDLQCKNHYEGAAAGVGAGFSWEGNNKVGAGRMTILESRSPELIRIKLEFFKPFKATNTAEFTFRREGDQTAVTWAMFGDSNFVGKIMNVFMNCDKMVGGQFEIGLASMKSLAEATARK